MILDCKDPFIVTLYWLQHAYGINAEHGSVGPFGQRSDASPPYDEGNAVVEVGHSYIKEFKAVIFHNLTFVMKSIGRHA